MIGKKKVKYRHSSLALSRSIFKMQMKYLKNKGYKTLNCTELYLWRKGKIKLTKKSVLITFDDGYIGQEKYAMPILKKYNFKATAFIIRKLTYNNEKDIIKIEEFFENKLRENQLREKISYRKLAQLYTDEMYSIFGISLNGVIYFP